MPRPKNSVPTYRLHKQSGQAIVTVTENGVRQDICLGRHGSPESKEEYERILTTIRTGGTQALMGTAGKTSDLTVVELLTRFMEYAQSHYRNSDGSPTSEIHNYVLSFRPLREMYAHLPIREFGPKALKACRDWMIARRWCRTQINGVSPAFAGW